jgi:hypothetical protein
LYSFSLFAFVITGSNNFTADSYFSIASSKFVFISSFPCFLYSCDSVKIFVKFVGIFGSGSFGSGGNFSSFFGGSSCAFSFSFFSSTFGSSFFSSLLFFF